MPAKEGTQAYSRLLLAQNRLKSSIFIIIIAIAMFFNARPVTLADDNVNLQDRIEKKSRELDALRDQISETQNKLDDVSAQRRSLSREIRSAEYTIRNLELNIRGSEINIEKLGLELESLEIELKDTEKMIAEKKASIASVIRAINQREKASILETILSGNSLTDSIAELSGLDELQKSLSDDIASLRNLSQMLDSNIQKTDNKKSDLEDEQLNLRNRRAITQDQKTHRETILRETRNQESVYQKQLSELERKQKAFGDEIEALEAILRRDFDISIAPGRGFLISPYIGNRPVTQGYGATAFARTAYRTRFHNGIDYGMPIGTPITAAAKGRVYAVGDNGNLQYGRYIVIKHNDSFFTLYAHLSRSSVAVGTEVRQGEIIGYSGNTGFSTGPHLHLGVYQTMTLRRFPGAGMVPVGITMNPMDYF